MSERLPLFPLGTVLYPGLVLPLHIFEPRYRRLVHDLTAGRTGEFGADKPTPQFGVVAIRSGREVGADGIRELHDVGCAAAIHRVEALPDGRFDLTTSGTRRFTVGAISDRGPYLIAEVEYLPETDGDGADVLAHAVAAHYLAYREALLNLQGQAPRVRGPLPEHPRALSYLIAAAMVLDRADKQGLLACADTVTRLRAELALLRRERVMLRALPSLPGVDLAAEPASPN